jgi:hypothetical protein
MALDALIASALGEAPAKVRTDMHVASVMGEAQPAQIILVPSREEAAMLALIEAMFAGEPGPLGPYGRISAIRKALFVGKWRIMRTGLSGDLQADVTNHGGPEKALQHYPRDHYAA